MPMLPRHQRQPVSGDPKRSANSSAVALARHELLPGRHGAGEVLGVDQVAVGRPMSSSMGTPTRRSSAALAKRMIPSSP